MGHDTRRPNGKMVAVSRDLMTLRPDRSIVVPLDSTRQVLAALPVARELAAVYGATPRIVAVTAQRRPVAEVMNTLGLTEEQASGLVIDRLSGSPAKTIVKLAKSTQNLAIVLSPDVGMDEPKGKLGQVVEEVLRGSTSPVVLVRPDLSVSSWSVKRLLVPHDGTPASSAAIVSAMKLASLTGATLLILHVAQADGQRATEPGTIACPCYLDQPQHEWPVWANEFVRRALAFTQPPTTVETRLVLAKGQPGTEVVRFAAAQDVDLIVLAWHSHPEAQRAAMQKAIIDNAPCPTLIVKAAIPRSARGRRSAVARQTLISS